MAEPKSTRFGEEHAPGGFGAVGPFARCRVFPRLAEESRPWHRRLTENSANRLQLVVPHRACPDVTQGAAALKGDYHENRQTVFDAAGGRRQFCGICRGSISPFAGL